ncbi:MAG: type II toxin-antitoxin system HipA family toxin [Gammaproteobacteria bacterium]|nr:type II toxin-antitoxin system HipA family toxin [Gammaproteobacteria bacterium]
MNTVYKIEVRYRGWDESWSLGTLVSNGRQTLFEYSPTALERGIEFSPWKVKLAKQTYTNFPDYQLFLPGFIADSLPDGWGMLLMDRFFKKHYGKEKFEINPLERLAFLGENTTGAYTYHPTSSNTIDIANMSLQELAIAYADIEEGKDVELLSTLALRGGSAHGARPKALVYYDRETGLMNTNPFQGGEPWLVKFNAREEHIEVCEIEQAYYDMAKLCNIPVASSLVIPIDKKICAIAMKRFDRIGNIRVPMHSLAGAYATNFRTPNLSCLDYLKMTRFMTNSIEEAHKAFKYCVFNVCMNNRDDHSKNFSFLLNQSNRWEVSPAYDLTYNTGPSGHHQMDFNGEAYRPNREDLLMDAQKAGLNMMRATNDMDEIIDHTSQSAKLLTDFKIRKATIKEISTKIDTNILRLSHSKLST